MYLLFLLAFGVVILGIVALFAELAQHLVRYHLHRMTTSAVRNIKNKHAALAKLQRTL